jgi:hypothetical protein
MFSSQNVYENDSCPVRDELLGELYRADQNGLSRLVESVAPDVRAMLALFCYRKAHLHSLAIAIATSCSERDLFRIGGRVGLALHALSRQAPSARPGPVSSHGTRKPITLSTTPLRALVPFDDDLDDETAEAALA